MSDLDLEKFRTVKEIKYFAKALWDELSKLKEENINLKDKLRHSEELLKNSNVPEIKKVSMEENLILREIEVIDKKSKNSEEGLSMDETKRLKMLVDSIVALRRKEEVPKTTKKNPLKDKSAAELISIVKGSNGE